jgi:hypothetical protein
MDDGTMVLLITSLFALSYGGTWTIYNKVNKISTVLRILCREHSKNHGQTEIDSE